MTGRRRIRMAAAGAALLAAACTSSEAVRTGGVNAEGTRVEIASPRPAADFAACIQEKWALDNPTVAAVPYAGGTNLRIVWRDLIVAQVDVLPVETGGSKAVFTTPFAAQGHNFLPQMRACAEAAG